MDLIEFFIPTEMFFIFEFIFWFWWIWLPWMSWKLFRQMYTDYSVQGYKRKTWDFDLLEIVLEKGEEKTPKAMEKLITTLHGGRTSFSWWEENIQGKRPDIFSLEIVGKDGNIHFLIRTMKKYRRLTESAIYGAFPDVDIIEVEDYTKLIDRSKMEVDFNLFGVDFKLAKPDAYPIRTYHEFLDSDNDGKIDDPLSQVLENLANLQKGEQMWIQFVCEPQEDDKWIGKSQQELDKIIGKATDDKRTWGEKNISPILEVLSFGLFKAPPAPAPKEQKFGVAQDLTPGQADQLKAIERNMTKPGFKTSFRIIYIADTDKFSPAPIKTFLGALKQFNDSKLNSFKPNGDTITLVDDFFARSKPGVERFRKNIILDHYVKRKIKEAKFVFNTEELATVFHFPNGTVTTSTLRRIKSRKASPPTELPLLDDNQ